MHKVIENINRIGWAWCCVWVELNGKGRVILVSNSFHRPVVDFFVGHKQLGIFNLGRIDRVAMVLGSKRNTAGGNFSYRVVKAPVTKFHLKGLGSVS